VDVPVDGLTQDEQRVLDSVACSHELEDTCVGDEVTASAEEFRVLIATKLSASV